MLQTSSQIIHWFLVLCQCYLEKYKFRTGKKQKKNVFPSTRAHHRVKAKNISIVSYLRTYPGQKITELCGTALCYSSTTISPRDVVTVWPFSCLSPSGLLFEHVIAVSKHSLRRLSLAWKDNICGVRIVGICDSGRQKMCVSFVCCKSSSSAFRADLCYVWMSLCKVQ